MGEITKNSSLGLKVKSLYTQEIPHGSIVSFCPERRIDATGAYGVLDEVGAAPVFKWPGLNTGFGIDVIAPYEETQYNPVHATTNILELVRQSKLGEELTFGINTVPQKTGHFPLLPYITGHAEHLGDQPDSMSWLKELNGRYSLYTGIMLEDYKMEIPALGVAKESVTGFAGHRVTASSTNPAATDATENESKPVTWSDIAEIRMDANATPSTAILHCLSDISFGFTSEIKREIHPESTLTTRIRSVRVVSRKMFVSLKLTWIDQDFIDIVTGPDKLNLKLIIGATPDATTMIFKGLYWDKYIAKADPKELVGDTITCIVDQPDFSYLTA